MSEYLYRKEDYWNQKAGVEWLKDGEINIKFFYTIVNRRRSRLRVNKIQTRGKEQLEQQDDIVEVVMEFYNN